MARAFDFSLLLIEAVRPPAALLRTFRSPLFAHRLLAAPPPAELHQPAVGRRVKAAQRVGLQRQRQRLAVEQQLGDDLAR